MSASTFRYLIHLADSSLILAQRNAEWTGHGPVLEQDIAITNISLDLLGQARNFYQQAADIYHGFNMEEKTAVDDLIPRLWKTYNRELQEDDLAFLRDEHQFLNLLITELPRGDWAQSVLRQFFFSTWQYRLYEILQDCSDAQLAGIAAKSLKETAYHLRWSAEWVIRLGDGTAESHQRIKDALSDQWMFTGEMLEISPYEQDLLNQGIIPDISSIQNSWQQKISEIFSEAQLEIPASKWMQSGGKAGRHTEHLGFLLAEMQHLQRAYPNATW